MTIRRIEDLPESSVETLRLPAAAHGRSMDAEARHILLDALCERPADDRTWVEQIIEVGVELGGVDLPTVPEEPAGGPDLRRGR